MKGKVHWTALALLALGLLLGGARDCGSSDDPGCQTDEDCREGRACVDNECVQEDDTCICGEIYAPVCGEDGQSYDNECLAACDDVAVVSDGVCEDDCEPVACRLYCEFGFRAGDDGCEVCECNDPPECVCPAVYAPVCSFDGVTYGNECEAECVGAEVVHDGECRDECDPVSCPLYCEFGFRTGDDGCEVCDCNEPPACECPAIEAPVCGANGETYGNECLAACVGVEVVGDGACYEDECASNADCSDVLVCDLESHECRPACEVDCLRYTPVCGEDGVTYGCGEVDASCHGVEVDHRGECEVDGCLSDNDCAENQHCENPEGCLGPPCSEDSPDCGCPGECVPDVQDCICPDVWAPVCGEDGQTYGNSCEARCENVRPVHEGECRSDCSPVLCQIACEFGFQTNDEGCEICACNEGPPECICPAVYAPVCGEDGQTYGNSCEARCEHVRPVYDGECEVACLNDNDCDDDQHCENPDGCLGPPCPEDAPGCGCPGECVPDVQECICPDVWAPVCGEDGQTYGNLCEARCENVQPVHEGECEVACGPVDCDLYCEYGFRTGESGCEICACNDAPDTCDCPDIWAPVCGENGSSYGNQCEARCAGVGVDHEGVCGGDECDSNWDCGGEMVCNPGTSTCQAECDINCFRYEPVCGENGVTYDCGQPDAWCHGVEVVYDGECRRP